jgi:uncharacterized protein YkwD
VTGKIARRFEPTLASLESRALLTPITATLSHGLLTVTRDDASLAITIDVPTKVHGKSTAGGMLAVEGVAMFNIKKVKAVIVNPGPSALGVNVRLPRSRHIAITINPATPPPQVDTGPPSDSGPPSNNNPGLVFGVTGVQSSLEAEIFTLINAQRTLAGVAPLSLNKALVTAAQIHARDMAALDLLEHDLPGVAQPTLVSRAVFVGYHYSMVAENIATGFPDAASVVSGWMSSPGHRANILDPNLTEAGVGVGRDAAGNLYFCQVFGTKM